MLPATKLQAPWNEEKLKNFKEIEKRFGNIDDVVERNGCRNIILYYNKKVKEIRVKKRETTVDKLWNKAKTITKDKKVKARSELNREKIIANKVD